MDCKNCRAEIEEAGWDAAAGAAVGAHLGACAGCRAFRAERVSLRGLIGGLARVDAPNDFELRLRARLATEGGERVSGGWQSHLPRASWVAVAGCLLLAVGVSLRPHLPAFTGDDSPQPRLRAQAPEVTDLARVNQPTVVGSRDTNARDTNAPAGSGEVERVVAEAGSGPKVLSKPVVKRRRQTIVPREVANEIALGGVETNGFEENSRSVIGGTVIPLAVSAEERPLQVTFKDMQGASRVVRVDPVAFGSREPALSGARVVNATHKQGVW